MLIPDHPYYVINEHKTFAFSAENPTGTRYDDYTSAPLKPLPEDHEMVMK